MLLLAAGGRTVVAERWRALAGGEAEDGGSIVGEKPNGINTIRFQVATVTSA